MKAAKILRVGLVIGALGLCGLAAPDSWQNTFHAAIPAGYDVLLIKFHFDLL